MTTPLQDHLARIATQPVHPAVKSVAESIRSQHMSVTAVLAYGSALRDSNPENTLIDYYVLTQDLYGVSQQPLSRALCRHFPPNVYYTENTHEGLVFRAKYAVLPMELLAEKLTSQTANPYFWARFCQPMRLIYFVDDVAKSRVMQLMERAAVTARSHARHLAPTAPNEQQWITLFRETYKTELRPEDPSRADLIVKSQLEHFQRISELSDFGMISTVPWTSRRWQGKLLSVIRLAKAAFTFRGGADYAAWKIKRHSGVDVEIKDWHRKHPLLASIILLPKLLQKGGLK